MALATCHVCSYCQLRLNKHGGCAALFEHVKQAASSQQSSEFDEQCSEHETKTSPCWLLVGSKSASQGCQ